MNHGLILHRSRQFIRRVWSRALHPQLVSQMLVAGEQEGNGHLHCCGHETTTDGFLESARCDPLDTRISILGSAATRSAPRGSPSYLRNGGKLQISRWRTMSPLARRVFMIGGKTRSRSMRWSGF